METGAEIEFSEKSGFVEFIEDGVNTRSRIDVFDGDAVEGAIVDAHLADTAICLGRRGRLRQKVKWRVQCDRRRGSRRFVS